MRDRIKPIISPEIRESAKKIYDGLPKNVKKGEWVSDAIEEKWSRDQSKEPFTHEQQKWIMDRITEAVHACYKP